MKRKILIEEKKFKGIEDIASRKYLYEVLLKEGKEGKGIYLDVNRPWGFIFNVNKVKGKKVFNIIVPIFNEKLIYLDLGDDFFSTSEVNHNSKILLDTVFFIIDDLEKSEKIKETKGN